MSTWDDKFSRWRTAEDVARYLRFFKADGQPDRRAAIDYMHSQGIPPSHCGRRVIYDRYAVEGTLAIRRPA